MRLGTPSGFSTMSTCVPSSRNGMSSTGTMRDTTPLLPCRPAILSPGWILRFTAMKTLTIFITPGGSSSPRCSFSTLSRNRCSRRFFCSSYWPRMPSRSDIILSSDTAICHHCDRGASESASRVIASSFLIAFGPPTAVLPDQHLAEARIGVAVEDRELVVAVLRETLDLLALDRLGALVLVDAVAVEHPDFDDRARDARAARAARCRERPTPSRRRSRGGAFPQASSGFRPSA